MIKTQVRERGNIGTSVHHEPLLANLNFTFPCPTQSVSAVWYGDFIQMQLCVYLTTYNYYLICRWRTFTSLEQIVVSTPYRIRRRHCQLLFIFWWKKSSQSADVTLQWSSSIIASLQVMTSSNPAETSPCFLGQKLECHNSIFYCAFIMFSTLNQFFWFGAFMVRRILLCYDSIVMIKTKMQLS